ncbi:MAG: pyridoxal-phosphate dependent enzyme, partial [Lachnospiraceae bacterium]|nr:pyridoxal-phosphate dependent enzyme [Lachnospiraceae bacterium]
IQDITDMIGNTPLLKIDSKIKYYAKIEGSNLFGSVKDRAARYLMENAYNDGIIKSDTTIIESSSGNFGIALAGMCKIKGNHFICVVDPNITEVNRKIIELLGAEIVIASKSDENGNYVQDRIRIVKDYISTHKNTYWTNQYENKYVREAYLSLGEELCNELEQIDYVFVAVSTCGTLAGTSQRIKKQFPHCKIIAVDIAGSQIFEQNKRKKHISGIGTGFVPHNLEYAKYDDYMIIEETDAISECNNLLSKGIVVGASSGAVVYAIQNYMDYSEDLETKK